VTGNIWQALVAGSVSVTSAALGDDDLSVYFRQPEGKVCIAVAGGAAQIVYRCSPRHKLSFNSMKESSKCVA